MAKKYDPLADFLSRQTGPVTLTFGEVARLLGCMETKIPARMLGKKDPRSMTFTKDDLARLIANAEYRLPPSAYEHQAWWAGGKSHCFASSWTGAGYTACPDMAKEEVTFRK